jgi:hypothetical protein
MSNPPRQIQHKDAERLEAERLALQMSGQVARIREPADGGAAAAARIPSLTDHQLRTELFRLRQRVESIESGESRTQSAQSRTREILLARYRAHLRGCPNAGQADQADQGNQAEAHQVSQAHQVSSVGADEMLEDLAAAGIAVAEDGLVEIERITALATDLVGGAGGQAELAIAMYHHTSSALLDVIRAEGLRVGKQTNFFNTQQGVYLSTMRAGQPVSVYSARAARVHGGDPTTLRVRRVLSQITPDPDDVDLAWAQGRQYITAAVPPADIIWERDQEPAPVAKRKMRPS